MASRPLVTVQSPSGKKSTVVLPHVLVSPIRTDVVIDVHTKMRKNHRQPFAVSAMAGAQTSAQSWGTGRAVSRIPRVAGGGTHRSGQGAFGNMCRGGRMFSPTKVWRRWHVRISKGQRRFATCSALAATACAPLLMARGHRIEHIPEVPLVIADSDVDGISKTKEAIKLLQDVGAFSDIERVQDSRHVRAGSGKARNRRYTQKRGPLIIHTKSREESISPAFRNIPGVDLANVYRLNLLQLAPGGHVGRFIIWTESAFKALDKVFGTRKRDSLQKSGFRPPRSIMTNADLGRIINSPEVQAHLRPAIRVPEFRARKKNPLKNLGAMVKLNPYALTERRRAILASQRKGERAKVVKKKRAVPNNKRAHFNTVLHTPAIAPLRSDIEKGVDLS